MRNGRSVRSADLGYEVVHLNRQGLVSPVSVPCAHRNPLSDQFDRFGFRSFTASGNQILLNGRRFKLRGANRHEDHPGWDPSLPLPLIRQDLEILKRMGAKCVRGHYPFADLILDYCDRPRRL